MKKHNKPSNGKTSKDLLKQVQALGGQFEDARSMNIPSGCTFKSLKEDKVIKFLSDWIFEEDNLTIKETKEQEVVYLPNLVEDSSGKAYNNLEQFLTTLPKIDGLKWIIPTSSQVCYVLGKHYKEHKEYLLKDCCTYKCQSSKSSNLSVNTLYALCNACPKHSKPVKMWGLSTSVHQSLGELLRIALNCCRLYPNYLQLNWEDI